MNNIYITKTLVANDSSLQDLDMELYAKFGFDFEDGNDFITIRNYVGFSPYAHATPVEIDVLIARLAKMKNDGATHVEIEDNCDHHGYEISSFEIRKSTPEETQAHQKETGICDEKQKKINALQKQIDEIKNS